MSSFHRDDDQPQTSRGRWKFDRHINVAHIVSTLLILLGVFKWASVVEQRLVQQEERLAAQVMLSKAVQESNASQVTLLREEFSSVRREITRTNEKLDRLLENQLRNHDREKNR